MIYGLPESLEFNGKVHPIRTDFRDIMRIIFAMHDPDLQNNEKAYVCLYVLYEDFDELKPEDFDAAFKAASEFIDCGGKTERKGGPQKSAIDFEQDEPLLIAAVNRVAGKEVRSMEYLHWWTFMGFFMEIGDCTYRTILNLRSKRNQHKTLEKWEQEFWNNNKEICEIREKLSTEEKAEYDKLKSLLD